MNNKKENIAVSYKNNNGIGYINGNMISGHPGQWNHYSLIQSDQSSSWSLSSGSGRGNLKMLATPDNRPSPV
jgi:hypothetical protein